MAELRLIKLKPPTLLTLAYKTFVKAVWQWKLPTDQTRQLEEMKIMLDYVQQLPLSLLDELFCRASECKYVEDEINTHPSHVALFVHNRMQGLILDFDNENFDVKYLLDSSGEKMKKIRELKLPLMCSLPTNLCIDLCTLLPNLQRLDLFSINVGNDAMKYLATLSLKELRLVCTQVTDIGLQELCKPKSKARRTLQELHVVLTSTTMTGNILVLRSMPKLECLDCNQTQLIAALPEDLKKKKLNLKKLGFFDKLEKVQKSLEIAVKIYKKAVAVKLKTDRFTLPLLLTLTKFEKLTFLSIDCDSFSGEIEKIGFLCVRHVNFGFPNVLQLSLRDPKDVWFSSGCFLLLIAMCPKLEKLKFKDCPGFREEYAFLMAQVLGPLDTGLQSLYFEHCILITPNAISSLLELPSLLELETEMFIPKSILGKYDIPGLHNRAVEKNIKLNVVLYEITSL